MCFHISGIYYNILYVGAVNVLPYIGYTCILYYIICRCCKCASIYRVYIILHMTQHMYMYSTS